MCLVFRTFLSADDTNLTADNNDFELTQKDLVNVEKLINANKLSLNPEKSFQLNIKIGNSASNVNIFSVFKLNSVNIPESDSCKYLGVRLDKKMKSTEHIEEEKKVSNAVRNSVKIKALCTKKCLTPVLFIKYQTNYPIWCADLKMCKLYRPSNFSSIAKKFSDSFCFRNIQKM